MLTKLSYWLAKKLAGQTKRDDVDFIRYGIEVTLSTVSKLLIFFLIAIIFHVSKEMFTIIVSFVIFRIISGGVHMSTYLHCLITSTIMFFLPTILFHEFALQLNPIYWLVFSIIASIPIIIRYVPVDVAVRPIPKDRHWSFKWTSFIFVFSWFIVNLLFVIFLPRFRYLSFYSSIGILLQDFTLIPFGFKLLTTIDHFFQKKR